MSPSKLAHLSLADGHTVPWLAFGSGTALIRQDVSNQVLLALQCGFTHIDTATFYSNEESVGAGIARASTELAPPVPRSSIFITTKLAELDPNDPAGVEGCLRASLTRLQVDYVDLYLIHVPRHHQQYPGRIGEVWREMVGVRDKGLAKSIGVSNFKVKHMEEIRATGLEMPAVNQLEYHLFLCTAPEIVETISYHKTHNILTSSWGGFTPVIPSRPGPPELEVARQGLLAACDKARTKRGQDVTQTQIILKWLQQKGILVVTTSTKESRIKEYLSTAAIDDLTPEEITELEAPCQGVEFRASTRAWQD